MSLQHRIRSVSTKMGAGAAVCPPWRQAGTRFSPTSEQVRFLPRSPGSSLQRVEAQGSDPPESRPRGSFFFPFCLISDTSQTLLLIYLSPFLNLPCGSFKRTVRRLSRSAVPGLVKTGATSVPIPAPPPPTSPPATGVCSP